MEFLLGRLLTDALANLGLHDVVCDALRDVGCNLDEIVEHEADAALGNGGLGRLAACLLESMTTLGIPAMGYGIRYEYGMFAQRLEDGGQVEEPDPWLRHGYPWEFARPDVAYPIGFYGRVERVPDASGGLRDRWTGTTDLLAVAYDIPVSGYRSERVNTLRLWSARAPRELDLRRFNDGDHIGAVGDKALWENVSRVLYPNDMTAAGRELRFKQEYFFVSATMQDILARFLASERSLAALPDGVAIQINDTHPALGIAELMRLLVDIHGLEWDEAWAITRRCFGYTNHTLMPEALETWPLQFFETLLPRHLQIIYRINEQFLDEVARRRPGDVNLMRRVSFIDEAGERRVRMAHLAIAGSHKVNGVSQVHTRLMRETVFADFHALHPDRILNITNGVTPRRWLGQANPALARLLTQRIGGGWPKDLDQLERLAPLAEDAEFRAAFRAVKAANKRRLAGCIEQWSGVRVEPDTLFDVHVKRIHEYKRQLLKLLHVIVSYNRIRAYPGALRVPRAVIFAGKAAPGYAMAKLIVRLIAAVARTINADPLAAGLLKVVFVPNYGVSIAERIVAAADLSEQISTAGTEASGTGNMKLALNGALTIGTLDGANIEIRRAVGEANFFAFGLTVEDIERLRADGYDPTAYYRRSSDLIQALDMIACGHFSRQEPDLFRPIVDSLTLQGDRYFVLADFAAYDACQSRVDALYRNPEDWSRRAILNVARMGCWSSDRAVREYARLIWGVPAAEEGEQPASRPRPDSGAEVLLAGE